MWADTILEQWEEWNIGAHTYWKGIHTLKNPFDLWVYQEIVWDTKPDIILETGTYHGGSAHYLADLGVEVHSVDIAVKKTPRPHSNITFHAGRSTDPRILYLLTQAVQGKRVMVVLDSDHHRKHVLDELDRYAPFVSSGCYLIVEDTCFGRTLIREEYADGGPGDAIDEWLPTHPEFTVDRSREKYGFTMHPGGFLLRA